MIDKKRESISMLTVQEPDTLDATGAKSQTSHAYETIRGDILAGRHAPEKKLKIQDLAGELEISPGAVREALSRLVSEQLVISRDQRGFVVAPLSISDLEDLTDLRCEIEEIALRRSVERGDVNWEVGILSAAHRLRVTPIVLEGQDKANPEWIAAHAAFHAALVAGCGSNRLRMLHGQLYEQSERYRQLSGHYQPGRDVSSEHQMIGDYALARDADRLVETQISHIIQTTRLIVDAARNQGSPTG